VWCANQFSKFPTINHQVVMSETINASSNDDPESRKQVEINLPRLRVQTIKYLLSGGGRKGNSPKC
jgi:hypothetical protein